MKIKNNFSQSQILIHNNLIYIFSSFSNYFLCWKFSELNVNSPILYFFQDYSYNIQQFHVSIHSIDFKVFCIDKEKYWIFNIQVEEEL